MKASDRVEKIRAWHDGGPDVEWLLDTWGLMQEALRVVVALAPEQIALVARSTLDAVEEAAS